MATESNQKFTITAPKSILLMLVVALASGGAGMASGSLREATATQAAPVGLSRVEVQAESGAAEARARAYADTQAAAVQNDCRRDLSTATTTLTNTLIRLEGKVDMLGTEVGDLKIGVAELKSRSRR